MTLSDNSVQAGAGPEGPAGAGPSAPLPAAPLPAAPDALRRRRRRLLLGTAPAVLAAAVVALKLLSLPVAAGQAAAAWEGGNADGTVRAGEAMGVLNMVERWKSHFATGDGHVLRGDFEKARAEFATALELVPAGESCKVRVNLVLSLEKLGEAKEKAGDPASAMEFFAQGSETVAQAPRDCFAPDSPNNGDGEGDALRDAAKRLEEKQSGAGDGGQDGQEGEGGPGADTPPPAGKMEQLKESGQQAQRERSNGSKLGELLDEDPPQHGKPW